MNAVSNHLPDKKIVFWPVAEEAVGINTLLITEDQVNACVLPCGDTGVYQV